MAFLDRTSVVFVLIYKMKYQFRGAFGSIPITSK